MASRPPFTADEKNELLAEIIKQSQPNPNVLLNIVSTYNIQPDWPNLPLPRGRSLNACSDVFNDMRRTTSTTGMMPTGYGPQAPSPLSSAAIPLKRPFAYESSPYSGGRRIEPKPSSASGPVSQLSPIDQPPKKKRGRPTKAEAQAKAEAESQQAQALPPPPMAMGVMESGVIQRPPAGRPSFGTGMAAPAPLESPSMVQPPAEEVKTFIPPVTRMPISSIITPTAPKSASQSSSSSGKRKRGRSTRSDPDNGPSGEAGEGQRPEYESPYAQRMTAEQQQPQDSPARAAQLRHREEQESVSQQPPQPPQPQQEQQETQEHGARAQGPAPETTPPDHGTK